LWTLLRVRVGPGKHMFRGRKGNEALCVEDVLGPVPLLSDSGVCISCRVDNAESNFWRLTITRL
jgi:hypothetical protein